MNPPQPKALLTYSRTKYKGKKDNSQGGQNTHGQQKQ